MSRRAATRLAWSLCLLGIALNLAVGGLLLLGGLPVERANPWGTTIGGFFVVPVMMLAFGLVGALLASRLPRNPVGWICLFIGLNVMLYAAANHLAYALMSRPGLLPAGEYMAWFVNWSYIPFVWLLGTFLVLLFPNGRLPTQRWRPVAWLSGAGLVLDTLTFAFSPGPLAETPNIFNPVGIEPARSALEVASSVALILLYRIRLYTSEHERETKFAGGIGVLPAGGSLPQGHRSGVAHPLADGLAYVIR